MAARAKRWRSEAAKGWIDDDAADLLEALSSALAQAEKERDEAKRKAILWDKEGWQDLDAIKAQRDSALSQLAEARGENAWGPIESAPKGDEIFMAATADGRIMIFRGSILANMMKRSTPDHLQFPATHWRPLPSPPH